MNSKLYVRLTVTLVFTIPALLTAQTALRVQQLQIAEPTTIAELDMGKLKGTPSRLAWSEDGSRLYVQTMEGTFGKPNVKLHHYVFTAANGTKEDLQAEPAWASTYWTVKSGQTPPGDESIKIALETEQRRERTVSVPRGGELARGGGSPDVADDGGAAAAYNSQVVQVHSMRLWGETIGQFENSVIVPGLTFGWAPKGSKAIAFAAQKSGRIVLMDSEGNKREISGSQDGVLPAWSPDGGSIAWLQKEGRRNFLLRVARVSSS